MRNMMLKIGLRFLVEKLFTGRIKKNAFHCETNTFLARVRSLYLYNFVFVRALETGFRCTVWEPLIFIIRYARTQLYTFDKLVLEWGEKKNSFNKQIKTQLYL